MPLMPHCDNVIPELKWNFLLSLEYKFIVQLVFSCLQALH